MFIGRSKWHRDRRIPLDMTAMASCICFSFKFCSAVAAATVPGATSPHRRLSSLLHPNATTTFHKAPTLRATGRQPPAEAAPFWRTFWPRLVAEAGVSGKDGAGEELKSLVEELAAESPVRKLAEEAVLEFPVAKLVEEVAEVAEAAVEETEGEVLKRKLLGLLKGTDRGLLASSEATAETLELISRLEALNPTPAPTDDLALLDGKWILAYSSSLRLPQTLRMLLSALPVQLVKVDEISQDIDAENLTLQNSVKILFGPIATTSLSTNAKFEVQSYKRLLITCTEGLIGTPQLVYHIDLSPLESAMSSFQGKEPMKAVLSSIQKAELLKGVLSSIEASPLKGMVSSLEEAAAPLKTAVSSIEEATAPLKTLMSSIEEAAAPLKAVGSSILDAASSVAKAIADQVKPLKIPIPNPGHAASSWLLTTYLDEGMRISRTEDGSVFVLVKSM